MTDSVRKIFDILGVEPNEIFKVDGFDYRYYINERLFVNKSDGTLSDYLSIKDFLTGDFEIIKLPKKKKLRDLTEEEYNKWKNKNCGITCKHCPFDKVICASTTNNNWVNHKDLYSDKFLDQEIEVEE